MGDAESADIGIIDVVHHHAEDVGARLGQRTGAMADGFEVRSVGAAHDDNRIDGHRERDDVAHDSVRRRVDDYTVVIGPRPLEKFRNGRRTENLRGGNAVGIERSDDMKILDLGPVDEFFKVRFVVFTSSLHDVRETRLFGELNIPDFSETRPTHVEVHVQGFLSGLGVGDGERRRCDRLAFARHCGYDEQTVRKRLVAGRIKEIAQSRDRFGKL